MLKSDKPTHRGLAGSFSSSRNWCRGVGASHPEAERNPWRAGQGYRHHRCAAGAGHGAGGALGRAQGRIARGRSCTGVPKQVGHRTGAAGSAGIEVRQSRDGLASSGARRAWISAGWAQTWARGAPGPASRWPACAAGSGMSAGTAVGRPVGARV